MEPRPWHGRSDDYLEPLEVEELARRTASAAGGPDYAGLFARLSNSFLYPVGRKHAKAISSTRDLWQDAVQRSVLKVHSTFVAGDAPQHFVPWYKKVVRNFMLGELKSGMGARAKQPPRYVSADELHQLVSFVDDELIRLDLERAIEQIPDRYRAIVIDRLINEFTLREIAKNQSVSLATVVKKLKEAIPKLAAILRAFEDDLD